MVAIFRSDYQEIKSIIALETQTLKAFDHGKPIVLNIYTPNGDKVVVGSCNVSEINTFRQLAGRGSIDVSDGLVVFSPDGSDRPGINYEYVLGSTAVTSAQIEGKQPVTEFEFEIVHNRIEELKAESREVLAEFRAVIEQRGWNRREVFAAAAQLVGEKSISQDFVLSCLPEVLNEYVVETGVSNIVVKTEYASYLTEPTKYMVTPGEAGVKKLEAQAIVEGKQQWIEVGDLVSYGNQLLDKSTFSGLIEPSYNTVTFISPNDQGNQRFPKGDAPRTVAVGKLTSGGRTVIEQSEPLKNLQVVRRQTPSYRLKFEDIDIKILDLAPAVAAVLSGNKSTDLVLERLHIFDNKFSATAVIDDQTYYLSGVNASSSFEKKNRDTVVEPVRQEQFEGAKVLIVRDTQPDEVFEVYSGDLKIGEITQKAELAYWGNRFQELEEGNQIEMKVQTVTPKYLGYSVRIDENTLFNNNVWAEVAPAQSYQGEDKQLKTSKKEEKWGQRKVAVIKAAVKNLRRVADANCYPQSFSVRVMVPIIDQSGLKEVEQLQLVVPNHKIDVLEKYFKKDDVNVKYTKLERGIPSTYEESRRAYTVLRVNLEKLAPNVKGTISRQLGKPVSQADYEAKLATIPITNEWTPIKLNSLKKWIEQYPQSKDIPVLDLDKSKPVPFTLKPITGEVQTRFKGNAMAIGGSIVFEFVNLRQRDTAMHHLGLPISAELPSVDGKTRYFAVVEAATLQTYLNDCAVSHVLIQDGVKRTNPILNSYSTSKDWTKLQSRAQTDIIMGFAANKYIGIPLEAKSRTTMYRDNWGTNANAIAYKSTDVVMVTGNRTGKETSNELLARHFRTEYLPLLNAAVQAQATILVGADTGIDRMVKDYLVEAGYNLHLNSAGIYEASNQAPAVEIEVFVAAPKQEMEQEEEQEYAEMTM